MFKGIYTIHRYNGVLVNGEWVRQGAPIEIIEKDNVIQYKMLDHIMANQGYLVPSTARAYISLLPVKNLLYANPSSATQWIAGAVEENAFWTAETIDPINPTSGFWTFRTRFTPGASVRYIYGIALGNNAASQGALSCVSLGEPCIQETDNILDIFYRIFVDLRPSADGRTDINQTRLTRFGQGTVVGSSTSSVGGEFYPTTRGMEQVDWDLPGIFNAYSSWRSTSAVGSSRDVSRSSTINSLFGHVIDNPIPGPALSLQHGVLFRSMMVGSDQTRKLTLAPVDKGLTSNLQNIFPRSAHTGDYRKPFLEPDKAATSVAEVSITDSGTWAAATDDMLAHHYRIEITQGGAVGAAEYRLRKRVCSGWNFASPFPMVTVMSSMKPQDDSFTLDDTTPVRYGQGSAEMAQEHLWPEFITFDVNGITIVNVNGTFENIDADSAVPLPTTGILQIATEYSTAPVERISNFYVACENSGLWKVVRPSGGPVTSITQITPVGITNPNSCRGVAVNRLNGDVWAIFSDLTDSVVHLAKSTDEGLTWTLYNESTDPQFLITNYTSGTPGPSNIIALHIDPNHVDNRLFICCPLVLAQSIGEQGTWWSEAGSSPTSDQVRLNSTAGSHDQATGGIKTKRRAGLGMAALETGNWLIRGTTVNQSALAAWGSATASAISMSNTSAMACFGKLMPMVFKTSDGNEWFLGNTALSTGQTGSVGNRNIVLRPNDQYTLNNPPGVVYLHDFSSPVENLQGDPQTPSRPTRSTDVQPTEHAYTGIITHIGKGVFLTKTTTNSPYCLLTFYGPGLVAEENQHPWFESYGWNGSSWELNHPGSKVTHAAVQDLIDTLQISFDDTGGLNELVTNEYYDAYAYNGIIVDDATAFRQSLYHFMQATETGTDFTPAVVPAADVGAVTDDRLAMLHQGQSAARLGLTTPYVWGESGKLIAGSSGSTSGNVAGYAEHRLVGDFEFRFKMVDCLNAELRIGLMNWTSIQSGIFNLPITDAGHRFNIAYNRTGVNNPSGAIDYSIRVNTVGLNSATSAATISKTNASEDDVFAFRRVGTTITLLVNDVVEYTYGTATAQDLGIVFANVLTTGHAGWTLYDGELDHTINRRYVEIGNGTTTGARDINFGRMVLERMEYNELNIELDGTPASILTDGVTEPGVGEVNVLPYSGRLWFNAADAGKTITGNWRILKKLNLE